MFTKNKDTVLVNRLNEAISTAKSPFIGTWYSTRNTSRFIKVTNIGNENFVETNINDTITKGPNPKKSLESVKTQYSFQSYKTNNDSINVVFFFLIQQKWMYGLKTTYFRSGLVEQIIPYKIVMLKDGSIMDIATGEVFSKILDLNDEDLKKEISINKLSENQIQLSSSISLTNAQLTLYDMKGTAFAANLQQDNTIDVSNLQAGLYVLRLQTADQKLVSFKFLKQ
jgi:hypothetical protein